MPDSAGPRRHSLFFASDRRGARGTGLGRQLAEEIIAVAQGLGYSLMRLDTLDRLTEAMRLYESLGFRRTEPYYDNPLSGVVYWELDLNEDESANQRLEDIAASRAESSA